MAGMTPLFRRNSPASQNQPERQAEQRPDRRPEPVGRPEQRPDRSGPRRRLVTLVRKPGCHLCDDAQSVVEKVCGELGVTWEQKDISEDPQLHDRYWEQIPVVLIDGAQHTFWRVNEDRLRKALTGTD
jgi:glutaredoxin-like protein DUF836